MPDALSDAVLSAQIRDLADLDGVAWFEVDGERRIVQWSAGAERLTGFSRDEVVSMPCVVGVRCQACLGGCGVMDEGEVREVPMVLHHKDGSPTSVLKSGRSIRDGQGRIVGAVEVMRPSGREVVTGGGACGDPHLDLFLRSLGRVAILAGPDFRLRRVSEDLAGALGSTPDELIGAPLSELLGDSLFGPDSPFRRAVSGGQRREGWSAQVQWRDGPMLAVSLSAARVAGDGDGDIFLMMRPEDDGEAGQEIPRFEGMVARSASMHRIFRLIDLLRENDATVLITGESGTGKELVARALHSRSHRKDQPFVAVNCGAIPPDLLESELFGHVRGAFTGAVRDRVGRFEAADGGTLFLDEVGDLPGPLQVKLLRVLQDRTFERVGDSRSHTVDVRVVAATNSDLLRAVMERRFRDDLYYRLRVVPIEIPPLRERREDLELLVRYLMVRISRQRGRSLRLSPSAMRELLAYAWPGNVRELENALEYAMAVCEGQTIHLPDLPAEIASARPGSVGVPAGAGAAVAEDEPLDEAERTEVARIREALERARYRRSEAASLLGMSRTTLWRKMKVYRLG